MLDTGRIVKRQVVAAFAKDTSLSEPVSLTSQALLGEGQRRDRI
jgi:hypothetical protein